MEYVPGVRISLGLYLPAQAQLERALQIRRQVLGLAHPDTVRSMSALAALYVRRQQYQAAER